MLRLCSLLAAACILNFLVNRYGGVDDADVEEDDAAAAQEEEEQATTFELPKWVPNS